MTKPPRHKPVNVHHMGDIIRTVEHGPAIRNRSVFVKRGNEIHYFERGRQHPDIVTEHDEHIGSVLRMGDDIMIQPNSTNPGLLKDKTGRSFADSPPEVLRSVKGHVEEQIATHGKGRKFTIYGGD